MKNIRIIRMLSKFLLIIIVVSLSCFGFTGCNSKRDANQTNKSQHKDTSDDSNGSFLTLAVKGWKEYILSKYLNIEIGPDEFSSAVKILFGITLTESDFTDRISVSDANRHCVIFEEDITLIYIEFPNEGETSQYWDYMMSLGYSDDWLSWNGDSEHCFMIWEDNTVEGFYRCGNVLISFASGSSATNIQEKSDFFFEAMGCPTVETVAGLIQKFPN